MKQLQFVVSIVVSIMLITPAGLSFAQPSADLGAESSGLLPSNPFYFLKEWGRGFKKFISFNPVRKAQLQLDVVNEKAAELKKLEEITPENIKALIGAADNYKIAAEQLRDQLNALNETGENPNVSRILDQLADRSLKHQKLFDDLLVKFQAEEEFIKILGEAQEKLAEAIAIAAEKVDSPSQFRRRFSAAVQEQKDDLKELRAFELLDKAEPVLLGIEARKELSILKEDLLLKFSGRLQGFGSSAAANAVLQEFADDQIDKLRVLDEVREKVANPEIKSSINVIRQHLLSGVEGRDGISQEKASQAIEDAKKILSEVIEKAEERGVPARSSVRELISRTQFSVNQAVNFYEGKNYGSAYGQATAAYAAAKSAWTQLFSELGDYSRSLEELKSYYDSLREKAASLNLNKENNPKLFALFAEAEKRIVEAGKLIEADGSSDAIASILRNVKVTLASIEELIKNIIEPRILPALSPAPAVPLEATTQSVKDILVAILDDGFFPSILRISKGTKVTWVNKDTNPHWPVSDLPGFGSDKELKTGENYSFTFENIGAFNYHDKLNPALTAVVEVVE